MKGTLDDRWRQGGSYFDSQENKGSWKLKENREKAEDKQERERGCFLSSQEGMEQASVAETDRAKAERKTATTVDNFLILATT